MLGDAPLDLFRELLARHRVEFALAAMPDGLKMFPAYLRDAGYYTTNNNKKDYNAIESEGLKIILRLHCQAAGSGR